MRVSRSRWTWWGVAVFIVMLQAVVPQRAFAQRYAELLPGLRFGPPLKAGLALGVTYGDTAGPSQFSGPIAIAEAGLGGARASAGYLISGPFASGVEVLGSAIRTWGRPSQIDPWRTLAGGELRVSFFFMNAGVGVFRPVDGIRSDRRTRYYANFGFGI